MYPSRASVATVAGTICVILGVAATIRYGVSLLSGSIDAVDFTPILLPLGIALLDGSRFWIWVARLQLFLLALLSSSTILVFLLMSVILGKGFFSFFGVGGLGFTLHRARHVVLLERPWTPGDAEQAEDRCHRIGMQGELISHWLQLGVADQMVDDLIASKAAQIDLLLRRRSLPGMVRRLLEQW